MACEDTIDPLGVKKRSENIVLMAGGRICSWLPVIDVPRARARWVPPLSEVILVGGWKPLLVR
jgi:hypothetical protein